MTTLLAHLSLLSLRTRFTLSLAVAATCAAPFVAACGAKTEPQSNLPQPTYGTPTGTVPAGYPTGTAPAGYPASTAPGTMPTTTAPATGTVAPPTAGTALPGTSTLPAAGDLAEGAAELGLRAIALTKAPGMTAEGAVMKNTLKEGERTDSVVSMQAGKCYTIVGFSPPGAIRDVDLQLLAPPFYTVSAGQDGTHDATPVIGGGKSPYCPLLPVPVAYKLAIVAKSGAGAVAVQVYSKTK